MTELERGTLRHGVVAVFDEQSGLGVVTAHDGVEHPFHCIEIADGVRWTASAAAEAGFATR